MCVTFVMTDGTGGGTAGPMAMDTDDGGLKVEGADDDDEEPEGEEEECAVCHEDIENLVRAECGCGFCRYVVPSGFILEERAVFVSVPWRLIG